MPISNASSSPGKQIRQQRAQQTYDALVRTGFRLLDRKEFESITVAELAREAGYSVGAFYARFHSKDEFLDALVVQHMQYRTRARNRVLAKSKPDTLIGNIISELVTYYWRRRRFWRAALLRGMRDSEFWRPLRDQGMATANAVIAKFSEAAGRELTDEEQRNVRFALHMALGAINNSIVNRPGPILFLGRTRFIENLTRAFRLISNFDELTRNRRQRAC